ncbi:hypothetical protein M8818_007677 [Zalaria obscura]|uniref:Uncharacterized protein n=1 Tax=Zalaria obscura TaxID=2024903 RepID=A0ACC3S2U2_9PEZI
MQCIVGWNHCIDWLLSRGEVKAALKAYNEVASKIPDKGPSAADHITFTTILNGMREAVMAEEDTVDGHQAAGLGRRALTH